MSVRPLIHHSDAPPEWREALGGRSRKGDPLFAALTSHSLWLWLGLLLFWSVQGLWWRYNSNAPRLPLLFEELGVSLWLAGGLLSAPLTALLARRWRHARPFIGALTDPTLWLQSLKVLSALLACGALLSLSTIGALLPYRSWSELIFLATQDQLELFVRILPFAGFILLLYGALAIASSAVLHGVLSRMLGSTFGTLLWLIVAGLLHTRAFSGLSFIGSYMDNTPSLLERFSLTLGAQSMLVLQLLTADGQVPIYAVEGLWRLLRLALPLLILISVGLLAMQFSQRAPARARLLPLVLGIGISVPLLHLLPNLQYWLNTQSDTPEHWRSIFSLGICAIWVISILAYWRPGLVVKAPPRNLIWPISICLLPGIWILMSWPAVVAGDARQSEVLLYGACSVLLLTAGLAFITCARTLTFRLGETVQNSALLLVLILLIMPWSEAGNFAQTLLSSVPAALLEPSARGGALIVLACLGSLIVLAQMLAVRRVTKPNASPQSLRPTPSSEKF